MKNKSYRKSRKELPIKGLKKVVLPDPALFKRLSAAAGKSSVSLPAV